MRATDAQHNCINCAQYSLQPTNVNAIYIERARACDAVATTPTSAVYWLQIGKLKIKTEVCCWQYRLAFAGMNSLTHHTHARSAYAHVDTWIQFNFSLKQFNYDGKYMPLHATHACSLNSFSFIFQSLFFSVIYARRRTILLVVREFKRMFLAVGLSPPVALADMYFLPAITHLAHALPHVWCRLLSKMNSAATAARK